MAKKILTAFLLVVVLLIVGLVTDFLPIRTAPYDLADSPMVAMRIVGTEHTASVSQNAPGTIQGWRILQQRTIDATELRRQILGDLKSRWSYGGMNIRCFEPGIAIQCGQGANQVDAIICLTCRHIYFYRGSEYQVRHLTALGARHFSELYPNLFPGRSAEHDSQDNEKQSLAMQEELDRQSVASQPSPSTTVPSP